MNRRQKTLARRAKKASKIKQSFKVCQNIRKYKQKKYETRQMYDPETEITSEEVVEIETGLSRNAPKSKKYNILV